MTWIDWYNSLAKPSWTPAPSTISLIGMILYPIILVSFGFVFIQALRRKVGWKVAVTDDVFRALADSTRRKVLERLAKGPTSVSELAEPLAGI